MEPKQLMENSIKVLLHDVDRISTLVCGVQTELRSLEHLPRAEGKVSVMKEQLGEVMSDVPWRLERFGGKILEAMGKK